MHFVEAFFVQYSESDRGVYYNKGTLREREQIKFWPRTRHVTSKLIYDYKSAAASALRLYDDDKEEEEK